MTKVLLVEDDKSLREIYGVRLLAEGYDIVSAGDGEEALAMAIKERPALIVSDVMMPKISGFDMLDILRSTTETKDIKVIMMTALSSEDQRERGEKLGADRYLVKSQVGIEDVVRTVHEVLGDLPSLNNTPVATPAPTPAPAPQQPSDSPRQPFIASPPPPSMAPQTPRGESLPQPMAPFSSAVPRPAGLGDRVLQPLQQPSAPSADIAKMMEQELSGSQTAAPVPTPAPTAPPVIPTAPAQVVRPDVASLSPQAPQPAAPAPTPQDPVTAQPVPQQPQPPQTAPTPPSAFPQTPPTA